jgi:hypothetical protein
MLALMVLAVVLGEDPLPKFRGVDPPIGMKVVVHDYGHIEDKPRADVSLFPSPELCLRFEREWDALGRFEEDVLAEFKRKSLSIQVPDKTRVEVVGYGRFNEHASDNIFGDYAFVKVLEGKHKDTLLWVREEYLRVSEKDAVQIRDATRKPDLEEARAEVEPTVSTIKTAPLLLIDTSRNRVADFIQVHGRLRNTSNRDIPGLIVTVIFEDSNGKLVSTSPAIIGDVDAGETKTFIAIGPHDPASARYNFEFQGQAGKRIEFTTAKPQAKSARTKAKK